MFIFILICKIKIASTEWKIEILHRLNGYMTITFIFQNFLYKTFITSAVKLWPLFNSFNMNSPRREILKL